MRPNLLAASALACGALLGLPARAHADPPAETSPAAPAPLAPAPLAPAPLAPAPAPAASALEHYRLPNGLEVILVQDHRSPRVAVNLAYRVGSGDDPAGYQGLAHLFEHLMFDGSRHVGREEYHARLEAAGATDVNASTSPDATVYTEVVPAERLGLALWLESDRMAYLLDRLDARTLDEERRVVLREYDERVALAPGGLWISVLRETLYPAWHPYARLINDPEDLAAISLPNLQWFFQRYYGPDDAVLTLVGDLDPAAARAQVERYFGEVAAASPAPRRATRQPAPIALEQRRTIAAGGVLDAVHLVWRTPPTFAPGDAACDLLAYILAGASDGRLRQRLVTDRRVALRVSAGQDSMALGSEFSIDATAALHHGAGELRGAIDEVLEELRRTPVREAELEAARRAFELQLVEAQDDLAAHAARVSLYARAAGDPDYAARDLARYRAVTAAEIQELARTLLAPERRVAVEVVHEYGTSRMGRLARAARAHGGAS